MKKNNKRDIKENPLIWICEVQDSLNFDTIRN